ncbi:MAG: hypothetical protein CM15mP18_4370 [Methanobacteriota archaeon]|nr:MAG: hypothetical protein CM15mP18_4370 [Euryarchaeota archaeon]
MSRSNVRHPVHASDRNGEVDGPWACHISVVTAPAVVACCCHDEYPLRQGPFDGGFAGSTATWQEGQRPGRAA